MLGLLFSILSALSESANDAFSKKAVEDNDEYLVAWAFRFFSLMVLFSLLLFDEIPPIKEDFWLALIISSSLSVIGTILFMKALKNSDLSISIPVLSFGAIFTLIISFIILNEQPGLLGLIGIITICIGSYTLNIKEKSNGYLKPLEALFKEKGPQIMLLVALLSSIGGTFDKVGVISSSEMFWPVGRNLLIVLALTPIMLVKSENQINQIKNNYNVLILVGVFGAFALLFQMTALKYTLVGYVSSIRSSNVIIAVLLGYFIFKEKDVGERLIGAIIMFIGVILIILD